MNLLSYSREEPCLPLTAPEEDTSGTRSPRADIISQTLSGPALPVRGELEVTHHGVCFNRCDTDLGHGSLDTHDAHENQGLVNTGA